MKSYTQPLNSSQANNGNLDSKCIHFMVTICMALISLLRTSQKHDRRANGSSWHRVFHVYSGLEVDGVPLLFAEKWLLMEQFLHSNVLWLSGA